MFRLPLLEYNLGHPHPRNHVFLLATLVIFSLTLPVLVLLNIATLGLELVPSLQSDYQPNNPLLEGWWGLRRLPSLLRPKPPPCDPKDLGRGDTFRLSASLFDYTVMSSRNISEGTEVLGMQGQKRAEYRGQSFAHCHVFSAQFEHNLVQRTQIVTVSVACPGSPKYPVYVSMTTTITFSSYYAKDLSAQYYAGMEWSNMTYANPSDYRNLVIGALETISRDSITITQRQHLSNPALSVGILFSIDPDSATVVYAVDGFTYGNLTYLDMIPDEAMIYADSIMNLMYVAIDAVNLDLGNRVAPNMFWNTSRLNDVIVPNRAPNGINPANWAGDAPSYFYGNITPPYQTWAEMLLHGLPVTLGNPVGLPEQSVMATTYLCPVYQVKPLSSLLTSVFVGSATMIMSVWSTWMFFTAFVAKRMVPPRVQCFCSDCEKRQAEEEERARNGEANSAKTGMIAGLMKLMRPTKPTSNPRGQEYFHSEPLAWGEPLQSGRATHWLDVRHTSYRTVPSMGEKAEP